MACDTYPPTHSAFASKGYLMLRCTLRRMGGSLYIILPKDITQLIGVDDQDEFELTVDGKQITLSPFHRSHRMRRAKAKAPS